MKRDRWPCWFYLPSSKPHILNFVSCESPLLTPIRALMQHIFAEHLLWARPSKLHCDKSSVSSHRELKWDLAWPGSYSKWTGEDKNADFSTPSPGFFLYRCFSVWIFAYASLHHFGSFRACLISQIDVNWFTKNICCFHPLMQLKLELYHHLLFHKKENLHSFINAKNTYYTMFLGQS